MKVICAWCGRDIEIAADGSPLKDTYAIEWGDGDKFYFCGAGHAIWWLSEETDEEESERVRVTVSTREESDG